MIKIIIAEDHQLVREGIKALLDKAGDLKVVGEADNGEEVLSLLDHGMQPDVIVSDLNMPIMGGIELTEAVKAKQLPIKMILITMLDHEKFVAQAFQSGVDGYLLKNATANEMIYAIRHVFAVGRYLSMHLSMRMLERLVRIPAAQHGKSDLNQVKFSKMELEVLELIGEGYTNLEIAEKFFTSKRTIEGYRQTMLEKTGLRNMVVLIKHAVLNGLIG